VLVGSEAVSSEHAGAGGTEEVSDGDRVVDVLGVEVVIEEDFVSFPWRAGVARAPLAFLVAYALVASLSAVAAVASGGSIVDFLVVLVGTGGLVAVVGALVWLGDDAARWHGLAAGVSLLALVAVLATVAGTGSLPFVDQYAILGIVTYNAHNVHAVTGLVPDAFAPVADPVLGVPVVGRLLQGLFAVGQNHAAPIGHLADIAGGATGTIGHVNLLEQQETRLPGLLYYLVPVGVLVGAGYEFAATRWEDAATDSPLEVTRFGIALGLGYVATMLVGTVVFTYQGQSSLSVQVYTVMPDRYLALVFGFVYPAILGSLGAAVVYVQRR